LTVMATCPILSKCNVVWLAPVSSIIKSLLPLGRQKLQ
jgi:hypothetical protein